MVRQNREILYGVLHETAQPIFEDVSLRTIADKPRNNEKNITFWKNRIEKMFFFVYIAFSAWAFYSIVQLFD